MPVLFSTFNEVQNRLHFIGKVLARGMGEKNIGKL